MLNGVTQVDFVNRAVPAEHLAEACARGRGGRARLATT
jgi:hypothetical protein